MRLCGAVHALLDLVDTGATGIGVHHHAGRQVALDVHADAGAELWDLTVPLWSS
jgi:hypothetical protein